MKYILLVGAPIAALLAVPSIAQQAPMPPAAAHMQHGDRNTPQTRAAVEAEIAERFAAADANKDGAVTQAEFKAYADARQAEARAKMAEMHGRMFAQIDTDSNGQVSRAEWDAHHAQMQTKREQRRDGAGRGERGERRAMKMHGGADMQAMHRHAGGWSETWFETADADKDGRVTLAEASARALERFDRMDANKDGTVTLEERKAAHEAMRAEWRAKRGS